MVSLRRSLLLVSFLALAIPSLTQAQPSADFQPDPVAVQRYGPAYRFPQAGWTVLHIEGEPYERGYQHGRLMATEIAAYVRCFAALLSPKSPAEGWGHTRRLTNALFVRRFDKEFLEEMKGIADGATAAGAKYEGRPIDLVDIVAINCWPEIETLDSALEALPTGLEGIRFAHPQPRVKTGPRPEHCSAFAATGPATADGKVIIGHITMFSLYAANFYNVWIDVKPAKGHRVLMCAYPGAMQSGMDYYLNDAGLVVAETTISQTRFDITGQTEASRIRKALQYGSTIDDVVAILRKENNGLYANEWLLADINTNEIALFELGTHKSKLHRSSKNEWIGGTTGFYWGCNNTKDMDLRLETIPSVTGRPHNLVFRPSERDIAWQKLYEEHKGKMDVSFGKLAFTAPPLAAHPSLDAKFTTTDLARQLKSWALFGPPLGRTWQPTNDERQKFPEIKPLVTNPWTILHANPPAKSAAKDAVVAVDLSDAHAKVEAKTTPALLNVPAWHGTILPQSDGDIWLATAFADYQRYVAKEKSLRHQGELTQADRDDLAVDLFAYQSSYYSAVHKGLNVPLSEVKSSLTNDVWYELASGKGVLVLHELRKLLGDPLFESTMDSFGLEHAGKKVATAQFQAFVEKKAGKPLDTFFDTHVRQIAPAEKSSAKNGADTGAFSITTFHAEQPQSLIVYGTLDEMSTNRETAEILQKALRERWQNYSVPIKSDKEVTDSDLKTHHLLLIGRPDSNILVERCRKTLPITFGSQSFTARGKTYAHPGSAVIAATDNPINRRYSAVVFAGLSAESTLHSPEQFMKRHQRSTEVLVLPNQGSARALIVSGR